MLFTSSLVQSVRMSPLKADDVGADDVRPDDVENQPLTRTTADGMPCGVGNGWPASHCRDT